MTSQDEISAHSLSILDVQDGADHIHQHKNLEFKGISERRSQIDKI